MTGQQIHFVTGRLAEHALRQTLEPLAEQEGFTYSVDVLPISVAALMTPRWIAARLNVPEATSRIILPGYCDGDLSPVTAATGRAVELGPRDLRELPKYFGRSDPLRDSYGDSDIEIIAEINHAPRLSLKNILSEADRMVSDGADIIDVGCDPGDPWPDVGLCVGALREAGHRVSIDSLNPTEIEPAVRAGAELVFSVNASNRQWVGEWGCEVVAIPDDLASLEGLQETVAQLEDAGVPFRIDPVLEPIGFGFAASLGRYLEVRRRYPTAALLMGIGNLTELTDVDSAGINVLLLGFCQELEIRSVLTTQVIHWARTSVRECELARRLVFHAVRERVLPKHLEPDLVVLRDTERYEHGEEMLERLTAQIKDYNYRIFAEQNQIHVIGGRQHWKDTDPFVLFDQLLSDRPKKLDASHAFYLGYEMAKAVTALTLDKHYQQDEPLNWGYLTRSEPSHRSREKNSEEPKASQKGLPGDEDVG